MITDLQQYSPEELLSFLDEAKALQEIEDHKHFKYFDYKRYPKQLEFFATGKVARERLFRAGNRVGKSYAVSREGSMHLTGIYPFWWPGHEYTEPINMWVGGVAERELAQLKEYYVGSLRKPGAIHPSLIIKQDLSQNLFFIKHASGGISSLRFKTYKQGHEAWQAETVDLIHLDEEPLNPKIYSEAVTRTASVSEDHYGMVMLSMTPLSGMTSLMLKYRERPVFDANGNEVDTVIIAPGEVYNQRVFIEASHDDAPHLSEAEKNRLYSSWSPHEREARKYGLPSLGSGLIYPLSEGVLSCEPFSIPEYWPRCYGMDFGWHNTAAIFGAIDPETRVLYLTGEYKQGHLTPRQHTPHLTAMGADWMWGAYDYAGESAAQINGENLVELYEKEGIKKWVRADKSFHEGICTVLQMMESDQLKIFSTLKKTFAELRSYIRDDNGKVKKGDDHLLDALRYLVMSSLKKATVKPSVLNKQKIHIPINGQMSSGSWMRF